MKRWLAIGLLAAAPVLAALKLPPILADHMVLQQGVPVRIWGQADAGQKVAVEFQGQSLSGKADTSGNWAVFLSPLKAGAPSVMTIRAEQTLTIADVLVGEVWVGSGQSNMHFPVSRLDNAGDETAAANYPQIRFFDVDFTIAETPASEVKGKWYVCSPQTVRPVSAVGYFFARDLHRALGVPVGFIHASGGGTAIQSWISRESLQGEPAYQFVYQEWQKILDAFPAANERYLKRLAEWNELAATAKRESKPEPPNKPGPPHGPGTHLAPSCLYNGMLLPITKFAIRGVTWYQGETNGSGIYAYPYRRLFRTMIEDWRRAWGEGDFPFLFVELANLKAKNQWPIVRESQAEALGLRNTAMAVTIDIGNSHDIHPTNKQEVGRRLTLAARAMVYGEKVEYSGPVFRQFTLEGDAIRLWFEHANGLELRGSGGFMIAGSDGRFVPAESRVDGATVVVSSHAIAEPAAVRYAWANDPCSTLYNRDGLPASPFRTDRESKDLMAGGQDKTQ